jgi:hypothetical protein
LTVVELTERKLRALLAWKQRGGVRAAACEPELSGSAVSAHPASAARVAAAAAAAAQTEVLAIGHLLIVSAMIPVLALDRSGTASRTAGVSG